MRFLCILILLVLCSSCRQPGENERVMPATGMQQMQAANSDSLLHRSTRWQAFSEPVAADLFVLELRGESIATGSVYFSILHWGRDTVFRDTFPAKDFLMHRYPDEWGKGIIANRDSAWIVHKMEHFFDNDRFLIPPLASNMTPPDSGHYRFPVWERIKLDSTYAGYYYKPGDTGGVYLAWAKTPRRMFIYYTGRDSFNSRVAPKPNQVEAGISSPRLHSDESASPAESAD